MHRRARLAALALSLVCVCAVLASAQASRHRPADPSRPNVIVLMTDDMRADDLASMPITRRLFERRGVTFDDATSTYPLCCPARAVLLSGQYNHNNGVQGNAAPRGGMTAYDHRTSIATSMAEGGYQSAFVGKYLNGYDGRLSHLMKPPGWTTFIASNNSGIYDYWKPQAWVNGTQRTFPHDYTTIRYMAYVRRIVREWGRDDEPYFMWAAYLAPHAQCAPAWRMRRMGANNCWGMPSALPRDMRATRDLPPLSTPSLNELDVTDKGAFIRRKQRRTQAEMREVAELRRYRIASLQSVDRSVGVLVRMLRRTGELDNTYIVFTSDNGHQLGEHRWLGKTLGYEESLRVPLLMMGPDLPRGVHVTEPVALVDLPRTIAQWTGTTPARTPDGISLRGPIRRAERGRGRDRVVPIEAGPISGRGEGWLYQGVRSKRYTYFRWKGGFEELYDRRHDPYQLQSVTESRRYRPLLRWARQESARLDDCVGDDCVAWYDGPELP